jgi:2-oxoacid:acceptor oxidoreductase gamma subunit (pyruvate/2-ketoisovalerate family)
MERELLITGIGGQGVQLAAQVVARAATNEGREVMFFGLYGGMMRGGNTDSTIVVADQPIEAPPVVSSAWSAIGMHDEYWEPVERRLRPGGVVLVNVSTFTRDVAADVAVHRVPATELAADVASPLGGSMAMIGAYAAVTGLVELESLATAMHQSIPSYRRQHIEANERALRAGYESVPARSSPAWSAAEVGA